MAQPSQETCPFCVCSVPVWEQVLGAGGGIPPVFAPMESGAASLAHQLCMGQA